MQIAQPTLSSQAGLVVNTGVSWIAGGEPCLRVGALAAYGGWRGSLCPTSGSRELSDHAVRGFQIWVNAERR